MSGADNTHSDAPSPEERAKRVYDEVRAKMQRVAPLGIFAVIGEFAAVEELVEREIRNAVEVERAAWEKADIEAASDLDEDDEDEVAFDLLEWAEIAAAIRQNREWEVKRAINNEREACAKLCESFVAERTKTAAFLRGQPGMDMDRRATWLGLKASEAERCANGIRARGKLGKTHSSPSSSGEASA